MGPSVLISPVQASTRAGLEQLFVEEAKRLVGALSVYSGDRTEAEDMAQEAFARLYANWSQIRDPERARSYLFSVAFNLARTRGRRRAALARVLPRLGRDDPEPDPEAEALRAFADEATLSAVAELPSRQRACVILHYYADLSVIDTAAALGISTNSAKTHLKRALSALRVVLEEDTRS